MRGMSRRRPIGDARHPIALQNLGENRDTCGIDWDKETQLPENDLGEHAKGAQPIPHSSEQGMLGDALYQLLDREAGLQAPDIGLAEH
jgi:hypothetical protein